MPTNSYRPVLVLAPGVLAGAEKVVLTGIAALYELGLNPLMIIIKETRSPKTAEEFSRVLPNYIEQKTIDTTKALDHKLPGRLAEVLKQEKLPVILHSHGFKALIACYLSKLKAPLVHTHHGNTSHTLKVKIYEKMAMLTMKRCDQVVAVSYKMQEELQGLLAPYKKIVTIENMLSFNNVEKIRQDRAQKNTQKEIIELIYIGRLSPEKGLISFLNCLKNFSQKNKFHLTVLGDGVERPAVEKFLLDHNMSALVTLHGFTDNASTFLTTPDVLIMPSLREGLPMTLIEALASGIPVVANNVGAISSMVTHKHNGFLAADLSEKSWEEVLNETLKSYEEWKKHAEHEAQGFEKRFSVKTWAQKTQEVYQAVFK